MAAAQAANNDTSVNPESTKRLPRKRTKTTGQATNRTKKARLGRLLDMPPEVFNEIAAYLLPADLLSLARSNKFFRNMFMSRTSQYLWSRALENIPYLPPCPSHLSEPKYVSLLFSKTCSSCGARVLRQMDPYLYVRLCNSCRDKELTELPMFSPLLPFLPTSNLNTQSRPGYVCTFHSELLEARDASTKNNGAFTAWQKVRAKEIAEQEEFSATLETYLLILEDEREMELEDLKRQRQNQIESRLFEEGWTKRDMEPSPSNSNEWHKLVWQSKPITDRTWANLYPKLRPLLNSNRAHNDQADKVKRRNARITKLQELTESIRAALPPLVRLTFKSTPQNGDIAKSNMSPAGPPSAPVYPDQRIDQPFPTMAELLTWPMIKNIVEDDTSPLPEDAGAKFEAIRHEFDQAVVEWREKIEQELVDIWIAGGDEGEEDEGKSKPSTRKGKGKAVARTRKTTTQKSKRRTADNSESITEVVKINLPDYIMTFTRPDGTTTTNLSDLSPNLQLLLRADTIFKSTKYVFHPTYPDIVPRADPLGLVLGGSDDLMYGGRWDASVIQRDIEKSTLAKKMLELVGRPEAISVEMKGLGGGKFLCGRCHQATADTWDRLVSHYADEQSRWKQAQEKIKAEPGAGFVYNNSHDLEPGNPKPFAQFLSPQTSIDYVLGHSTYDPTMLVCIKCEEMGIQTWRFRPYNPAAKNPMEEHLHDVYGGY